MTDHIQATCTDIIENPGGPTLTGFLKICFSDQNGRKLSCTVTKNSTSWFTEGGEYDLTVTGKDKSFIEAAVSLSPAR